MTIGADNMIDLLIEAKVISRDWTFNQISDLKNTIEELSTELYSEMKLQERFELIRECPVNDLYVGQTFEDAFREVVMTILRGEVAGKIKNMLGKATIRFGDNNEISERSVGGKPHKERSSNEKKDSKNEE